MCEKAPKNELPGKIRLKKIDLKTQNDLCEITEHQLARFRFDLDYLI